MKMKACPTCGLAAYRAVAKVKKGRTRVRPIRLATFRINRHRYVRKEQGQGSIRVYGWKRYGSWVACPDPYHESKRLQKGEPATLTTNINLHDPEAPKREKNKAKRHKALQSKDKR